MPPCLFEAAATASVEKKAFDGMPGREVKTSHTLTEKAQVLFRSLYGSGRKSKRCANCVKLRLGSAYRKFSSPAMLVIPTARKQAKA